jgi:hypothetical protein
MDTGDGELFSIENVDIVTDNAEYSTRSVSAREVGGRRVQECPLERVSESAFRSWPA